MQNFFDEFCDENKFEELEMDMDLLYLCLAEENQYDCFRPEKKGEWENFRRKGCKDSYRADSKRVFFHDQVVAFTRHTINKSLDCLKKNLGVRRCYAFAVRLIVAMTTSLTR